MCRTRTSGTSAHPGEIVEHGRRQRLALRIERHRFQQAGSNSLRRASLHLAIDDHRIDELAAVLDDDVVEDLDQPCAGVDRDERGMVA